MPSVLLTNGGLRKTLAAARSLGKGGLTVDVCDVTRLHPAGFSKYARESLVHPDPRREPDAFADWLERTLLHRKYDAFFPMDDDVLDAVVERRDRFEPLCAMPLPPSASYRLAGDKGESTRLAAAAGVACPQTIRPASLEEVDAIAARHSDYPVVVKPRRSSGSRGIRVARSAAELTAAYREAQEAGYPLPLIQAYVAPGDRYDVCLLYDAEGRLAASFVQKELRHFPVERGPSTAQESVRHPELLEASLAIMERLPWRGVVELEFMVDPADDQPKFMEINPRFWNSLQLAISAGVDFPRLLYDSLTGRMPANTHDYVVGKRCRTLLPGDALHFLANPRRSSMDPPIWAGRRAGVEDDIIDWTDPLPTLGFALGAARYALDPAMWRLLFRR